MASIINVNVLDGMKEKLDGLPFNLNRSGRRFLQEGPLDRLVSRNSTSKTTYYVYLFTDLIIYAEKKKKGPHKYVSHKYLANCLFIDYASTNKSLKYAFEIKNIESSKTPTLSLSGHTDKDKEKEEFIFIAKNFDQKNVWKRDLEQQINLAVDEEGVVTDASTSVGSIFGVGGPVLPDGAGSSAGSTSSLPSEMEELTGSYNSSVSSTPSDASCLSSSMPIWGSVSSGNSDHEEEDIDDLDELEIPEPRSTEFIVGRDDGSLVIQAGTVNFITWLLMYTDHTDASTIQAFLFTYKNFVTASDLLDILQEIYLKNIPPKDFSIFVQYSRDEIRKKVVSFLRIWVAGFFSVDFEDKSMYKKLLEFVDQIETDVGGADANEIKLAVLKANKEKIDKKILKKQSPRPQTPLMGENSLQKNLANSSGVSRDLGMSTYGNKFNEFSLTAVAEHLAHVEHTLYAQVQLSELANKAWMDSKNAKKNAPHVLASTAKFNHISQWVSTELLSGSNPKQRALMIERFIALANKCAEMNNYHTLMEILAGINRGYIDRLKKTWSMVSKSSLEVLDDLNELMDSKANFKRYREALQKSNGPCLPYFGIFLRDVVFIEEGNSDKTEGMVNYQKIQLLAKVYREVVSSQRKKYPPCEDENIILYFKQLWTMPDEVLYQISRTFEPSAARANLDNEGSTA